MKRVREREIALIWLSFAIAKITVIFFNFINCRNTLHSYICRWFFGKYRLFTEQMTEVHFTVTIAGCHLQNELKQTKKNSCSEHFLRFIYFFNFSQTSHFLLIIVHSNLPIATRQRCLHLFFIFSNCHFHLSAERIFQITK